jgi:hypothetical protein
VAIDCEVLAALYPQVWRQWEDREWSWQGPAEVADGCCNLILSVRQQEGEDSNRRVMSASLQWTAGLYHWNATVEASSMSMA